MNYEGYKNNLITSISIMYSGDVKTQLVRYLIDEDIATRKKSETDRIYIKALGIDEKISKCLNNSEQAFKVIEKFEMFKGYKYSILSEIKEIHLEELKNNAINIEEIIWNDTSDLDFFDKPLYYENEDVAILKFHKMIDIIDEENGGKTDVRYPLLAIIHKKLDILEFRFDKIVHKRNDDFSQITMEPRRSWITTKLKAKLTEYPIGNALNKMVDEDKYKNDIKEEICSFGYPGEKGVIVKYGNGDVMPFLGELEEIIKEKSSVFTKTSLEILENFIFEKKVLSSKHFREIKWIKCPYNGETENDERKYAKTRFIFNYKGRCEDLIIFYNSKYNDMERMNYVIQYIDKVKRNNI